MDEERAGDWHLPDVRFPPTVRPWLRLWLLSHNGPLFRTTRVSRYQKTNLDFTEARFSEWQWHQLNHMQVCTSLQTDNHVSTPPLSFLKAGCPSCRPTNSVKALKALALKALWLLSLYATAVWWTRWCRRRRRHRCSRRPAKQPTLRWSTTPSRSRTRS